jgi:hypothetical protein
VVERQPSKLRVAGSNPVSRSKNRLSGGGSLASLICVNRLNDPDAHVAQSAEHILGKDEVTGSIPVMGSETLTFRYGCT